MGRAAALLVAGAMVVGAEACTSEPQPESRPSPSAVVSFTPGATETTEVPEPTGPATSDGRPRRAALSVPSLGIHDLAVLPYQGWTDDAPGTRIQNRGVAASPFGPRGGVGPGGVGNYQVTAHRTSSTRAFEDLPALRRGDRIVVEAGGVRYVYRVTQTRTTSFRSARSLAEQRAAVPGHPGRPATRAMITLSTCLTREDHAAGNYWSDRFDNPEHRVDKIGVLVRSVVL
jgi:sortase A